MGVVSRSRREDFPTCLGRMVGIVAVAQQRMGKDGMSITPELLTLISTYVLHTGSYGTVSTLSVLTL
jgi:hypothetical protein